MVEKVWRQLHQRPSKTQICRNVILPDTQPACHPSSKGWKTTERTALIFDTQEVQSSAGSSFGEFLSEYYFQTNFHSSMSAFHQFKTQACKIFAHFSALQNNVRTHTGDKPFPCKFCSRGFAQSGVVKAHLCTYTGEKLFVCMLCGKMFAQSTKLTNHLRTHTGQKPYVCHYCGKCFSQPSTLRKHELSHTKERPCSCKFCGKAFAQQSTLTNQMRSHTGQN